jgi:predicted nucleic acid-binding protein
VADTSLLYAVLNASDGHHEDAREAFADPEPVLVPHGILQETLGLIQLRRGFPASWEAGAALQRLPHVDVPTTDQAVADTAWGRFADGDGDLSLADALVVAWCQAEGADPLAFDEAILDRT